eukprot:scaffold31162_cov314-Skeletonema_menzelii.AAC.1
MESRHWKGAQSQLLASLEKVDCLGQTADLSVTNLDKPSGLERLCLPPFVLCVYPNPAKRSTSVTLQLLHTAYDQSNSSSACVHVKCIYEHNACKNWHISHATTMAMRLVAAFCCFEVCNVHHQKGARFHFYHLVHKLSWCISGQTKASDEVCHTADEHLTPRNFAVNRGIMKATLMHYQYSLNGCIGWLFFGYCWVTELIIDPLAAENKYLSVASSTRPTLGNGAS